MMSLEPARSNGMGGALGVSREQLQCAHVGASWVPSDHLLRLFPAGKQGHQRARALGGQRQDGDA